MRKSTNVNIAFALFTEHLLRDTMAPEIVYLGTKCGVSNLISCQTKREGDQLPGEAGKRRRRDN